MGYGEPVLCTRPMRLLRALLLLVGCGLVLASGCGPSYGERLRMEADARQEAACRANPGLCALLLEGTGAAEPVQPTVIYTQPQQGVIWPWPTVGGQRYPGNPIGVIR